MADGATGRDAATQASELAGSLDLAELRARIDVLDGEIIRLLNERARLGVAAGRAKIRAGQAVVDADRERDVLLRVALANDGPIPESALVDLYRRLIEIVRDLQESDRGGRNAANAGDTR